MYRETIREMDNGKFRVMVGGDPIYVPEPGFTPIRYEYFDTYEEAAEWYEDYTEDILRKNRGCHETMH